MAYLTESDINTYLGISGETTLVNALIAGAEAIVHTYLGETSLLSTEYTEKYRYTNGRIFRLRRFRPTAVASVDATTLSSDDYDLDARILTLREYAFPVSTFPYKHTIVYTSGFDTLPDDISLALKIIVSHRYATRKTASIKSFDQGELSVEYRDDASDIPEEAKAILNRYKKPIVEISGIPAYD